jgi:NADH-quinone oxidoreductase subunit H
MISYEVAFGLILLVELICIGSLNLVDIVEFQLAIFMVVPFFPLFLMFIVSMLAETNRAPFDLPEAESELVSGFNVEYSSMGFALFFLAEYCSMIMMSVLTVILFLGG